MEEAEVELDTEEEEALAGLRFGRERRPPGALARWTRSEGLGGQDGLDLLSRMEPRPGREGEKRKIQGKGKRNMIRSQSNTAILKG